MWPQYFFLIYNDDNVNLSSESHKLQTMERNEEKKWKLWLHKITTMQWTFQQPTTLSIYVHFCWKHANSLQLIRKVFRINKRGKKSIRTFFLPLTPFFPIFTYSFLFQLDVWIPLQRINILQQHRLIVIRVETKLKSSKIFEQASSW